MYNTIYTELGGLKIIITMIIALPGKYENNE